MVVGAVLLAGAAAAQAFVLGDDNDDPAASPSTTAAPDRRDPPADGATTAPPTTAASDAPTEPASGFATPGLLTFRGSPSRSYYGQGPVPQDPEVVWSYPADNGNMCAESSVGSETKVWCGSGWTGQPSVFEKDGRTWVVFGAYDRAVHFVDFETGQDIIPPFPTGDIIKGSVSVDPDGFPLVYSGSRDNYMHVISIQGPEPVELWKLSADAVSPVMWNNDWDGSPLIMGDFMYEGGENSQFHVVKLNRGYAADGTVTVNPQLVFNAPGWDDELMANIGDNDVSIENSVSYHEGTIYFANSGGLVQGWDVSGLDQGRQPTRTFRFWTGDDTDASVVVDGEGFLYVASEYERGNQRSKDVGQLMKLDPRKPDDPLVWKVDDSGRLGGGIWATPALHEEIVIVPTDGGRVLGVDRDSGAVRWTFNLPGPVWQSSVIVDDTLLQGDCQGVMHAYDVSDTSKAPPELWNVTLGGCIESTPAVWDGRMFFGTRAGRFYALGDA